MEVSGTPGIPNQPPQPGGVDGPGAGQEVGKTESVGAAFGSHMQPPGVDAAQGADAVSGIDPARVQMPDGTNPIEQAKGIRSEIQQIRADLEARANAGEIDSNDTRVDTWRLLDLQTRAQDVAFRVELVTKVVEQATSGVKQISQTQA